MKRFASHKTLVTGLLLVAMATTTLAPVAEASNRKWKNRGRGYSQPVRHHYSSYVVRRSNAGPVIAGFLGGLFLGATIANAAPRGYDYYDPYCERRFATAEIYYSHARRHRHPSQVRVVSCESQWGCNGHHNDYGYHSHRDGRGDDRTYDRDRRDDDRDNDWRDRDQDRDQDRDWEDDGQR